MSMPGRGDDLAKPVLGDMSGAFSRRAGHAVGRCGIHFGRSRAGPAIAARRSLPLVSRSPFASNMTCLAVPIGRKSHSVPRARSQRTTPSVRTHGQQPVVAADRGTMITPSRSLETWTSALYSRAGSTWYVVNRSSDRGRSVRPELNTGSVGFSPVKLSTGRPRTASQSRRRFSQPLLARSLPAGWKVACKPPLVEPSSRAL